MKNVTKLGFQGDVVFKRVAKLPPGTRLVADDGPIIVAHSETGHHHVVCEAARPYVEYHDTDDPLVSFIHVPGTLPPGIYIDVEHQRQWDTHETQRLEAPPGAVWMVGRQREWVPEGWQRTQD